MAQVYLNGDFVAAEAAKISVFDRGFLLGDGVYELIPVYSRRPFRLAEHLARLERTLAGIRLRNPYTDLQWSDIFSKLIADSPDDDQALYFQITRGVGPRRDHLFPLHTEPTVFAMSSALIPPSAAERASGVSAISAADYRWLRCDLKTIGLLANCLLRQSAFDASCAEALLFRDGFLTEGAATNVFIVKNGIVRAPQKSHLLLPGITYDLILELAERHGLPYELCDIREDEVSSADEVWLTSSIKEVLAVTRLNDRPVGEGRPGPVWAKMFAWYQEYKSDVMRKP